MNYLEKNMELAEWILAHKEEWMAICGRGQSPMDEDEFLRLYDWLKETPYPELQIVLLTCNYSAVAKPMEEYVIPAFQKVIAEREK